MNTISLKCLPVTFTPLTMNAITQTARSSILNLINSSRTVFGMREGSVNTDLIARTATFEGNPAWITWQDSVRRDLIASMVILDLSVLWITDGYLRIYAQSVHKLVIELVIARFSIKFTILRRRTRPCLRVLSLQRQL